MYLLALIYLIHSVTITCLFIFESIICFTKSISLLGKCTSSVFIYVWHHTESMGLAFTAFFLSPRSKQQHFRDLLKTHTLQYIVKLCLHFINRDRVNEYTHRQNFILPIKPYLTHISDTIRILRSIWINYFKWNVIYVMTDSLEWSGHVGYTLLIGLCLFMYWRYGNYIAMIYTYCEWCWNILVWHRTGNVVWRKGGRVFWVPNGLDTEHT